MIPSYIYRAIVVAVHDGDTVTLDVDLGFYAIIRMPCRLDGMNARELAQPGGREAGQHLAGLIPPGTMVTVSSVAADKYGGRFDGVITRAADGVNINGQMVADGYAAAWGGTGPRPVPPWPLPAAAETGITG